MKPTYRMPAEWEPQRAVWLIWPHQRADWPGKFAPIPWVWVEIVRHIAAHQKVALVVRNATMEAQANQCLSLAGVNLRQIEFAHAPSNRAWARDSGAIFVEKSEGRQKEKLALDWRFNGWAKYPNCRHDDALPAAMATYLKTPRLQPKHKGRRIVLEGGSIDVNGKGALLTTEECLLSCVQERNPGFVREDYEALFAEFLGCAHTVWLNRGIAGDDTHGHVDDLARFVNTNTIAIVTETNAKDENHAPLKENLKRLKGARNAKGKPFDILELPSPKALYFEGTRLPASYANFLITNRVVLVPTFNDPSDRIALNLLAEAFPTREVIGIHAVDLVWGLGTLHCLSQQEPAL